MEIVKDIYFNTDKLVENTNVKVSYTGKLYQENNDKVFIHYGYGRNWNNPAEVEMKKTDLGYQTELSLGSDETINFCFKNQNNEWDNNFGNNYVFNIEKGVTAGLGTSIVGKPETAGSFFDKTFPTTNEEAQSSNVYWNSNNTGIIENSKIAGSTSMDTIITPVAKLDNIETASENVTKAAVTSGIENELNATATGIGTNAHTGSSNVFKAFNTSTALTVVNKGFQQTLVWTNKIKDIVMSSKVKESVCKFFSNMPKYISGGYKKITDSYEKYKNNRNI